MLFREFAIEFETLCVYFSRPKMMDEQCILDDYFDVYKHLPSHMWAKLCRNAKHQLIHMPKIVDFGRLYGAMPKYNMGIERVNCVRCDGSGILSIRCVFEGRGGSQSFRCNCKAADKYKASHADLFDVMGKLISDNKLKISGGRLIDAKNKHTIVARMEEVTEGNRVIKKVTGIDMIRIKRNPRFGEYGKIREIAVTVKSDTDEQVLDVPF